MKAPAFVSIVSLFCCLALSSKVFYISVVSYHWWEAEHMGVYLMEVYAEPSVITLT